MPGSDAQGLESRHSIDLSSLRGRTRGSAIDQATYLVDMAKAEALDTMGETVKAVELVDRHVQANPVSLLVTHDS